MAPLRRLMLNAQRLHWRLVHTTRRLLGLKRTRYVNERVEEYRRYWEEAAKTLGATLEPICAGVWEIRRGEQRTRIASYMVQIDDPVTLRLAGNKPYCCEVARRQGVPVAPYRVFRLQELDAAWRFMGERRGLFVVKPAGRSSSALGVTMHVSTRRQLQSAAALASLYGAEVMVEAMVPAESCRLLYLEGELIHAVRRRGVRLVGDGRSSIEELLLRTGLERLRCDVATLSTLQAQRLSLQSRPAAQAEIVVRYLPAAERVREELRTVYNECITPLVCSQLARSLGRVVREVGSRFAGVDVLTNDPGLPLAESGGVFLELNTTPGLHHHYIGPQPRPLAVGVLRHLLEEDRHQQRRDRLFA
jgi:D-alanine-D-alanine ligase-like ATP-grasp enzyme